MHISEIWRFPVKSLGGETLTSAAVDEFGIEGDRQWGLHDPATGTVLTARREPSMLFLSARLVDGRPAITCDEGSELNDDAALSEWFGRPVELRAASDGPGTFENPMDVEHETDWISWESGGGTFHDGGSKISFVTRSELGEWDARRFRLNVIMDGEGVLPTEGELAIGSAEVAIRKPIARCVMVTRAQPGIDRDLEVY